MRRLIAILICGLTLSCHDQVKLKVKVGVRDAGPTRTATTTHSVP